MSGNLGLISSSRLCFTPERLWNSKMSNAVLAEVGWDAGFAIPVANAENRALEEEVSEKYF